MKLTNEVRDKIARLYAQGYSTKALADRFGINEKQVRSIANRLGAKKPVNGACG